MRNQINQVVLSAAVALSLGCYGEMSSLSGSPCESDLDCPGTFACIVVGMEGTRSCQALVSDGPLQVNEPGAKPTPSYEQEVKPLLETYCNSCHGPVRTASGVQNMRFDQYEDDADGVAGAKNSARRIRIRTADFRDMPPPSFPAQPTDEERDVLARWEAAGAPLTVDAPAGGAAGGGATGADGGVVVGGGASDGDQVAGGGGGGPVDAGTVPAGPVSFANDVQPIFNTYCVGCHMAGNTKGNLNLTAGLARAELLNVPSLCNGSVSLVKAGDSAGSMLWRKIAGDPTRCNGTMPTSNALQNFDPDAVKVIEKWIAEGAKDN